MFSIENGVLTPAMQIASPNFNTRRSPEINLLVIHNISLPRSCFGTGHVQALFTNTIDCKAHTSFESLNGVHVSAHLFVERNGKVTQFVNFGQRAWHAGASSFDGIPECNDYSIGIELEGCDEIAYTAKQYRTLVALARSIMQHYPKITADRIVGHEHIAPTRKTDPGIAFDWPWFKSTL